MTLKNRMRPLRLLAFAAAGIIVLLLAGIRSGGVAADPGTMIGLTAEERQWLAEHPVVRVRVSPVYPPFEFFQEGRYQGLAVDYLDLVSRRLGIRFEPVDAGLTWSESLDRLREQKGIDLILMITRTDERSRDIEFTKNYISFPLVIFNRKDGSFISGIQDLRGKKAAVEKGFIAREWLKRDVPDIQFTDAVTSDEALRSVSMGGADAYVGNLAVGSYFIGMRGLVNLKVAAPTPYGHDDLAMGVRKDWPQLAALINRALDSITEEEAGSMRMRWLSVRYEHGLRLQDILFWVSVVAGISVLLIIQLRRLVRSRTSHLEKEIAERIQIGEALRESRLRYQALVDNLPIGVNMMDSDYRIVMSNETMGSWFSKNQNLFVGQYCFHEFEKRNEICEHCPGTVSMKTGRLAIAETEGIRDDGSRFSVRIRTVPIGPVESPTGFIELVEDITDIKKAQDERARLQQQLIQTQKMEAIGTLAGGIAHDFNNILAPILGYTEMASHLAKGDPKLAEYLGHVTDAATRATDLVRQILTFSRKAEQQKMPLQVSSVVKEALKLLRSSIPTTIEIRQEISTQALVFADPTQVHQIIMNLCTNAYQAMEQTGGVLAVSLKEMELSPEQIMGDEIAPGRYVVLEVSDTGCGMDRETQEKIFEPYFTTKEKGKGTGLGLAVVHGIVKDCNGRITVYSEQGSGTTFRVYLPVAAGSMEAAPKKHEEAVPTERHEHILFVDDEERICTMAKDYMTGYGYVVEVCSNGRDALFAIESDPNAYDLLVTDMTMPGMNGKDLAKKVFVLRPDLPVILCTGYSSLIDREDAAKIGIRDYVEKPVVMSELLCRIKKALNGI